MSDVTQGPGWWMASDGKWYPPETAPGWTAAAPTFPASAPAGFPMPGTPDAGVQADVAPSQFPTPSAPSMPTPEMPTPATPSMPSMPAPSYAPPAFGSPPVMPAPSYAPPAAPGFPPPGFPAAGPGFPQASPGFPQTPGFPVTGPGYAPGFPGGPVKQSNGPAIGALILGILAILTGWIFIGAAFGVVGLILGFLGLKKSKSIGAGKGMSIAGIVLSILGILSAVAVGVLIKKVVDKVDVADPNTYSISTTSCSVIGDQLTAAGEITNKTTEGKTFIVLIQAGSTSAQSFVTTDPNQTVPWSIDQPVTGATACGETSVRNFFNIDLNS